MKQLLARIRFFQTLDPGELSNFKQHSSGHLYFTLKRSGRGHLRGHVCIGRR
ncbi:MAG: exodeoxyribonuclease VII large subunit [Clostridia bacterium]